MIEEQKQQDKRNILLIIGIIFVACTMRPAITSVGPVINEIQKDMGISSSIAGFITTLPLLVFAVLSPLSPRFAKKLGSEMTIFISLLILGAGILLRSNGTLFLLFMGTALIGIGIANCNVLLPSIIKENFPKKMGLMTGIYTVFMAGWAGIASGTSVPLSEKFHLSWEIVLSLWALLIIPAIIFWIPFIKGNKKTGNGKKVKMSLPDILFSPIAWQVTLFMGLQSLIYFSMVTWLPNILSSQGVSANASGWMVAMYQFIGIPANFFIPVLADRTKDQKGLALAIGISCLIGLAGIFYGNSILVLFLSILFTGLGTGAAVSLALTLMGLRAANSEQAANLSAMSQSIGYLFAAVGPFIAGFLFDLTNTWKAAIFFMFVVALIMTISGVGAGRNKYVLSK